MDFISYGTEIIKRRIPVEILNIAFADRGIQTLEYVIGMNIMRKMVGTDLNLLRGKEIAIPIEQCEVEMNNYGAYITIPDEILQGRRIVSALSLNSIGYTSGRRSGVAGAFDKLADSTTGSVMGYISTDMEIVGEREIWVDSLVQSTGLVLRIVVEYSNNFNEIQPRSYHNLIRFFELAGMYYIWNKLILKVNEGRLYHGYSLDNFRSIIDTYESAGDEYREELIPVSKVLFMNDRMAMGSYITSIIPNN